MLPGPPGNVPDPGNIPDHLDKRLLGTSFLKTSKKLGLVGVTLGDDKSIFLKFLFLLKVEIGFIIKC